MEKRYKLEGHESEIVTAYQSAESLVAYLRKWKSCRLLTR